MSDTRMFLTFGLICCAGGAVFALIAVAVDAPLLGVVMAFVGGCGMTGEAALSA